MPCSSIGRFFKAKGSMFPSAQAQYLKRLLFLLFASTRQDNHHLHFRKLICHYCACGDTTGRPPVDPQSVLHGQVGQLAAFEKDCTG
jgi:hypothetical protein